MKPQGQQFNSSGPDLSVDAADYFGQPVETLRGTDFYGVERGEGEDLYRVEYLFLLVFGCDPSSKQGDSEYGGVQMRASTHLWLDVDEPEVPDKVQRHMARAAHRAGHLFDSSLLVDYYAVSSKWGDGYLTGFLMTENSEPYRNWQVEPVGASESSTPGAIRWTTEVYLDVEGTQYAELSGLAQGVANPWTVRTEPGSPGAPEVSVTPHKWGLSWNESRDEYQVSTQGRTDARRRYQPGGAASDKTVRINGKPVGKLDSEGRTWLKPEYARGDGLTFGGRWSREGLVDGTGATYSALRKGGVLYLTGETEEFIDLATAREKPEGYRAADHGDVSPSLEVQPGSGPSEPTDWLQLGDVEGSIGLECRQDKKVDRHLGAASNVVPKAVESGGMFKWPEFRAIRDSGSVQASRPADPEDVLDDDARLFDPDNGRQGGLDDFGGGE